MPSAASTFTDTSMNSRSAGIIGKKMTALGRWRRFGERKASASDIGSQGAHELARRVPFFYSSHCDRWDSNPQDLGVTSFQSWRVYRFRHGRNLGEGVGYKATPRPPASSVWTTIPG